MPPAVAGHYRLNNLSNPFNHFSQQHPQSSHYQSQPSNYQTQSQQYVSQASFPSATQNGQLNLFGSGLANGSLGANYGSNGLGSAGGTGLASQEAQMRFAHGAAIQQQQAEAAGIRGLGATRIREVWSNNLAQEMDIIRNLIDKYPFVSMVRAYHGVWRQRLT